jgi:DNA polymerase-3 subunit epsilon
LGFARWALPELSKYNQPFLADFFNININAAHRAYDDAKICGNIFLELIKVSADKQK